MHNPLKGAASELLDREAAVEIATEPKVICLSRSLLSANVLVQ